MSKPHIKRIKRHADKVKYWAAYNADRSHIGLSDTPAGALYAYYHALYSGDFCRSCKTGGRKLDKKAFDKLHNKYNW